VYVCVCVLVRVCVRLCAERRTRDSVTHSCVRVNLCICMHVQKRTANSGDSRAIVVQRGERGAVHGVPLTTDLNTSCIPECAKVAARSTGTSTRHAYQNAPKWLRGPQVRQHVMHTRMRQSGCEVHRYVYVHSH